MRRSHSETQELVAARVTDYVEDAVTEAVLIASLKALGLAADEIKFELWKAQVEKARTHGRT